MGRVATLVEEASIGVETGPEEYMFGGVGAVYATDERIYLIDRQVPAVRMYDHDGVYLGDLGRSGQGPGEYTSPSLLAVDGSGRVFVFDSRLGRINVYAPDGRNLDPWPLPSSRCCGWPMYPLTEEALWVPVQQRVDRPGVDAIYGVQAVGPEGPQGEVTWVPELDFEQATWTTDSGYEVEAPFSAWLRWNPAPGGRLVVGGSDRYRFEVHGPGTSRLVVERYWEPVPVEPERKEYERRSAIAFERRFNDPEFTLDASLIPDHKAAYMSLYPTMDGGVWVERQGRSVRLPDCVEDPVEADYVSAMQNRCWTDEWIHDAFDVDGRYLGEVEFPAELRGDPLTTFVDGKMVVGPAQDEAGTVMVKRYRLVLPGEGS